MSVFNINDLGGLQDYHKIIFFCVALHFSAIVIIKWLNSATLGATKTYSIIGLVSILTVFLIVKMNGFKELISIAVCSPMDFPISGVGPAFIAVFIFSAAFMVLGSVILHEGYQIPDGLNLLSHQESFLTNLHPSLLVLYRIGIFTAIGGTLFATFDVWTKSVYEGLIPFRKKVQIIDSNRLKRIIIITTSTMGICIIW